MKKLLLVLMVVAMASFLFVGCLPGTTTPPPEEPPVEPPVEPTITVVVEDEHVDVKTYIRAAKLDVTVTFTEAVAEDYGVYIKTESSAIGTAATSFDTARKVWTFKDFDFTGFDKGCQEICIIVEVKHPCCPGEEVYYKIVTVDSVAPLVDLILTFKDCGAVCDLGAYFEFKTEVICDPCCIEVCSEFASWSIEDTALCDPCPSVTGTSCPVEGTFACGCLLYAANIDYKLKFTMTDNVGNAFTDTWTITVDTDSVVSFKSAVDNTTTIVTGVVELYENCDLE